MSISASILNILPTYHQASTASSEYQFDANKRRVQSRLTAKQTPATIPLPTAYTKSVGVIEATVRGVNELIFNFQLHNKPPNRVMESAPETVFYLPAQRVITTVLKITKVERGTPLAMFELADIGDETSET